MVAEARAAARSEISFEVYVKRQGRWIIEAVLAEREQAFKLAEGLTAGKDVAAVRVVRECFDQSSGESVERVIFDSDIRLEKPAPARPEPPAPKAPARAGTGDPAARRATRGAARFSLAGTELDHLRSGARCARLLVHRRARLTRSLALT